MCFSDCEEEYLIKLLNNRFSKIQQCLYDNNVTDLDELDRAFEELQLVNSILEEFL